MFSIISRLTDLANSLLQSRSPYWVRITTEQPPCIYYFGDFKSYNEAQKMQAGYVEDLAAERAIGIKVEIGRFAPTNLTIMEEEFFA